MAKKPVVKKPADVSKTLFDELTAAAGITLNKGESSQDFAVRLGVTLSELDDDAYGKLSPEAVKWFTAATDAINADKEAPELDGFPVVEEAEVQAEGSADKAEQEEEVESTAAKTAATKKKAVRPVIKKEEVKSSKSKSETKPEKRKADMAKKAVTKKAGNGTKPAVKKTASAKPKEKKERAVRTDSVAYKLRVIGVKQPDITFEAACTKAGIKQVEGSHAWNVWYLTKLTMQVVKEVRS